MNFNRRNREVNTESKAQSQSVEPIMETRQNEDGRGTYQVAADAPSVNIEVEDLDRWLKKSLG